MLCIITIGTEEKRMKKMMPLLIVGMVILIGLETAAIPISKNSTLQSTQALGTTGPYQDELDQFMTSFEEAIPLGRTNLFGFYSNLSAAQSFTPRKEVLTRVQFLMGRNVTTVYPCYLAVRDNLTNKDIAVVSVDPNHFPVVNGIPTEQQLAWVEFNLTPLWVMTNQTYYLVLYTANMTDNYYWISGSITDLYPNGTAFLSITDGQTWVALPDSDACFKTYGLRETFLQLTPGVGSFGPSWIIKNIGNVTAWDVTASVTIKGGIFGHINKTRSVTVPELPPQNPTIIMKIGFLFGFGKITITIVVKAVNVRGRKATATATLIGFFIIGIK